MRTGRRLVDGRIREISAFAIPSLFLIKGARTSETARFESRARGIDYTYTGGYLSFDLKRLDREKRDKIPGKRLARRIIFHDNHLRFIDETLANFLI